MNLVLVRQYIAVPRTRQQFDRRLRAGNQSARGTVWLWLRGAILQETRKAASHRPYGRASLVLLRGNYGRASKMPRRHFPASGTFSPVPAPRLDQMKRDWSLLPYVILYM